MDLQKTVYLSNKVYIAKLTTSDFGAYDQQLFVKYYEPTVEVGGEITDGTTTPPSAATRRSVHVFTMPTCRRSTLPSGHGCVQLNTIR